MRDEQEFLRAASELIAVEERRNNKALVTELRQVLLSPSASRDYLGKTTKSQALPLDQERALPLVEIHRPSWTVNDIVLDQSARLLLENIIHEQRHRDVLTAHELRPIQSILLYGPPGCGKTLFAEVLSSSLHLPLVYVRYDAVVSSYLGETSSNLRRIFDFIETGRWVVLFDEFDIIGKMRDSPDEHGEMVRLVNNLIQMIDSYSGDSIMIAATNHEKMLDAALWRRFDEVGHIGPPDAARRTALFALYLRSDQTKGVDPSKLAAAASGLSPSDIAQVCRAAAKRAVLGGGKRMTTGEILRSIQMQKRRLQNTKEILRTGARK